jgi:hypothetical protein
MVNNETGIIEEEFRVEYVVDRVDTTSTVWMGLTLGCARCHDHKYDPITQRDFYRFFSYFNNVPERGLSGSGGNSAPLLKVPSRAQQTLLSQSRSAVATAESKFSAFQKQLTEDQLKWESTVVDSLPTPTRKNLVGHYSLDKEPPDSSITGSVTVVPGMLGNAANFAGDGCIQFTNSADFERSEPFSFGAWIKATRMGCVISKIHDANEMRGFDVALRKNKAIVNIVHRWNRNAIRVSTVSSIPSRQWQHLMVTYDGSSRAAGVSIYLDGKPQPVEINLDSLSGSIRNSQPLRIGRRQASASFSGLIDDVRIYNRQLSDSEVNELASSQLVLGIVSRDNSKRSAAQKRKLRAWFVEHHADERLADALAELEALKAHRDELAKNLPTTMVMQESGKPRPTFLLIRGQYDQRGEQVAAGIPEFLVAKPHPKSSVEEPNRLSLAKWLVDRSNPLTARVTVNRLWQQLFATGIVKTVDDFGTQGEWPSHPALLDWLAVELIESGWNLKHVLRLIANSSTYRQSSYADPLAYQDDPENRLLSRGPRFRLDAETIRDNALAISGLLVEKIGGPSVKPYQPSGLWKEVTYDSNSAYQQSVGQSLYRRSLYTFWKRQSPPPSLLAFDAPTRETCNVQRSRTNTPLQALILMNDPTFIEAARLLAERTMLTANSGPDRVRFAFRTALARRPDADETGILLKVFREQRRVFTHSPADAASLLKIGETTRNKSLDTIELAAWTTVAHIILSLDETITKP